MSVRWILLSMILLAMIIPGCVEKAPEQEKGEIPLIFVSIPPQKCFVERIVGDRYRVEILLPPGQSPATYAVTSSQMIAMANADFWFRVGVPFEKRLVEKIGENGFDIEIVKTWHDIERRPVDDTHAVLGQEHVTPEDEHRGRQHGDHAHHAEEPEKDEGLHPEGHTHVRGEMDPHIWLSPRLVKKQAKAILDALAARHPQDAEFFRTGYREFCTRMDNLSRQISEKLSVLEEREFLIFHPAFGYFAAEFGLKQIPIEVEGKTPSMQVRRKIIDLAKREGIHTVFVQKQFSRTEADEVARGIDGVVVQIDPLAEEYEKNLLQIATTMVENLGKE